MIARLLMGVIALSLAVLAGCNSSEGEQRKTSSGSAQEAVVRWYDAKQVSRGRQIYVQNCAVCHGSEAQGAPDWRQQGPDGRFPPPPLNGTAHSWHHPLVQLRHVIANGGVAMPAWKDRLGDREIVAVIAYFQSLWPDEVYAAWNQMNRRAMQEANQ
ncbi:MAG: cytochrome c [Gammaproteobacteria bacterium]|jgi:mono/diheme cytochrome c family protein